MKEYLKESKDANLQDRAKALKKKLNDLFKTSKDNDDSKNKNNNNDNADSEDNQICNFVDEVLKKVGKEIVNDDAKKVSKEIVNDDAKKVSEEIVNDDAKKASKEIVNDDAKKKSNQKLKKNITEEIKEIKEILELDKKYMKSKDKTDKPIKELMAELKDREEVSKKADEALKKHYTNLAREASEKIEKYNKIINDNSDMPSEKSEIINKLIELYSLNQIYNLNILDHNSKANKNINIDSIRGDIIELEKKLRELSKKGWSVFTLQKEFAKMLTFLAQLLTNNTAEPTARSSKKTNKRYRTANK